MRSNLPKVLHDLAGRPLLAHVLEASGVGSDPPRGLTPYGVRPLGGSDPYAVTVVYGHGGEAVRQYFAGAPLNWALQEPQLGTGHALMQALPFLPEQGTVLVLYGDVPLIAATTLRRLVELCQGKHLALLTQALKDPTGYGRIIRNSAGEVTAIREQKDASIHEKTITEINTGIMALPAGQVAGWLKRLSSQNAQNEYYLTDVIGLAAQDGVAIHTTTPGHAWEALGVNSKTQLAELERIHQGEIAKALMEAGVTLRDPARLDVRGTLTCAQDVSIDVGCVFEGTVVLENNVTIGAHCVIKNCTIGASSNVAPFSHLEGAVIGIRNKIGPYARLRPGTHTAQDVHVGNFVEVKNSELGEGTKANHLSYLGDATVGKHVNVGAGTITCNYDGVNKHRTVIEDDVFIGSDTQLVAPVTVGRGATIGAGSTIVTSVPADGLTLSRAKQTTLARWKRPVKKS